MIGTTPLDDHSTTSQVGSVNRQNGLRAATYMLASGIDLPVVQKILGHSQSSTTQVYAKVLEEQVHKQMKKFKLDL
ncbi:MAG: tyrosine-type recombinase/integrase [Syntrophobacteria bacterium]